MALILVCSVGIEGLMICYVAHITVSVLGLDSYFDDIGIGVIPKSAAFTTSFYCICWSFLG